MKQSKKFLVFGLLAGIAVVLFTFSPTIYAIVEPHITITMEPGQTTKPFTINDDTGSEVFSINPDGTISSAKVVMLDATKKDLFHYSKNINNGRGDFFKVWKVTKQPGTENLFLIASSCQGQVEAHEISGTTSSRAGFYESVNNEASYREANTRNINSDSLVLRAMSPQSTFFEIDVTHIAIGLSFSTDGNIGEARNFNFSCLLHLPEGVTITRVL